MHCRQARASLESLQIAATIIATAKEDAKSEKETAFKNLSDHPKDIVAKKKKDPKKVDKQMPKMTNKERNAAKKARQPASISRLTYSDCD